jgi:hypothetical protein
MWRESSSTDKTQLGYGPKLMSGKVVGLGDEMAFVLFRVEGTGSADSQARSDTFHSNREIHNYSRSSFVSLPVQLWARPRSPTPPTLPPSTIVPFEAP